MITLYKPVKIESAEQAEALPIGTVSSTATLPIFMKVSDEWWVGVHGSDSDDDERFENRDAVGITVLVPIEAKEEHEEAPPASLLYGPPWTWPGRTRYVTEWEDEL